jgi:regulator of replication initiation timing
MDAKLDRLGDDVRELTERTGRLVTTVGGLRRDIGVLTEADAQLSIRLDRIGVRLDRIERRLVIAPAVI